MNKYALLALFVGLMLFMVYLVSGIEGAGATDIGLPEGSDAFTETNIRTMLRTFFQMLFFRLENVPNAINAIFYPIIIAIGYMIVDILKDLVPFT